MKKTKHHIFNKLIDGAGAMKRHRKLNLRTHKPENFGILGTGNMASAIVAGVLKKKILSPAQIIGYDINSTRLKEVKKKFGIKTARSLEEVFKKAPAILLAV